MTNTSEQAMEWHEAIRIEHKSSGKTSLIKSAESNRTRTIFVDKDRDTAVIVFDKQDMPLPGEPIELAMEGNFLKVGFEIGWMGYPAVAPNELCLFSGRISAHVAATDSYLVDGIAINIDMDVDDLAQGKDWIGLAPTGIAELMKYFRAQKYMADIKPSLSRDDTKYIYAYSLYCNTLANREALGIAVHALQERTINQMPQDDSVDSKLLGQASNSARELRRMPKVALEEALRGATAVAFADYLDPELNWSNLCEPPIEY